MVFCDSCSVEQDFRLYGEAAADHSGPGYEEILVINDSSSTLYDVLVFKERENGLLSIWGVAIQASPQDVSDYLDAKDAFLKREHVVEIPPGGGADSFASSTQEAIGAHITPTQWYVAATKKLSLFQALKWRLGYGPVAIVIFPNGDVAKYHVVPVIGYAACCTYIEGSARNRDGDFIGPGVSDGSPYVSGTGGTGGPDTWTVAVSMAGGTGLVRVCGRVNGGPLNCYWFTT